MRKHQAMEESGREELPEELLIDILLRLPVKSLIRFTSVKKSWFSLIKSSEFAAKHYSARSDSFEDGFDHLLVAHLRHTNIPSFSLLPYETLDNVSRSFECKPFPCFVEEQNEWVLPTFKFAGPCRGIFCVMAEVKFSRQALLLWNPATREVKTIEVDAHVYTFGIGFDPNTNDYKVVARVAGNGDGVAGNVDGVVRVYSLCTDSWRSIHTSGCVNSRFSSRSANFFRDGSQQFDIVGIPSWNGRMFNWLGSGPCRSGQRFLITFDMSEEVFLETPLPPGHYYEHYLVQQQSHTPRVFCFSSGSYDSIDVWSLNEYGETGSWTKQESLSLPDCVKKDSPLVLWKTDAILFRHINELAAFSIDHTEQVKRTGVRAWHSGFGLGYTESLISIKGGNQQLEEKKQHVGNDAGCIENKGLVYSFGEVNQTKNLFLFQVVEPKVRHLEDDDEGSEGEEDDAEGSDDDELYEYVIY